MTNVTRVLAEQVKEDPFQRWGLFALPAWTRFTQGGQIVGLNNFTTSYALGREGGQYFFDRFRLGHEPVVVSPVAPRFINGDSFESPLQPSKFNEGQVLH